MTITPEELERLEQSLPFTRDTVSPHVCKVVNDLIATIREQWAEIERLNELRELQNEQILFYQEQNDANSMLVDELRKTIRTLSNGTSQP